MIFLTFVHDTPENTEDNSVGNHQAAACEPLHRNLTSPPSLTAGLRITEVSLFPARIIALPDAKPESTARKNRSPPDRDHGARLHGFRRSDGQERT